MGAILVLSIFLLTSVGVYFVLGRTIFRVVLGLGILGHAANLLVMTTGGWQRVAPLVQGNATVATVADPLPQALLLTAIVIGMAVTLYMLALMAAVSVREGLLLAEAAPATDEGRERDDVLAELEGRSTCAVTTGLESETEAPR